ncbi:hypothetical protein OEZ85_002355 [Tetradesmus obliquus]|uniref:ATP-dependent Clp protease proteolytic subunit n=1 Tax=Tetradesmus obliquus TaxID=3088 RepID=A0ABY8U7U5_TETOB|nr:hypothetical protein OEZ85_002355 [Tetradesmus obliquus]
MKKLALVVAAYRESLAWLKDVPAEHYVVYLYMKHPRTLAELQELRAGAPGLSIIAQDLPNVGREAHTYLHHMLQQGRDLHFCSPVNHGSAFSLIMALKHMEQQSTKEPIRLHLTTYGGSVHAAFAVVDTMLALKAPVHTVILGHAASAGTLISCAGSRRSMGRHATALLHEVSAGMWGKYSSMRDSMANTQACMDRILTFYEARTKLTHDQLRQRLQRDLEWDAQQCWQFGIVHDIM